MSVSIRQRLLLLVLSVLLPGLAGLVFFVASAYEAEREANTRTLRDTARALSLVVEGELLRRAAMVHVLGGSRWLDGGANLSADELQRFERLARRAVDEVDGWIELRAPDGVLMDTRRDAPAALAPRRADPDEAQPLAQQRVIEPLNLGPSLAESYAAVVEPVQRDGQVPFNLAITIRATEFQHLLESQQLPSGWYGTLLDSRHRVVARYPRVETFIGREATPDLRALMADKDEALFHSVSLDGRRTTGYFSTNAKGWTYLIAMPREQYPGLLPGSVGPITLAALAMVVLAVLGALWLSRRIVLPVHALKDAAAQMQNGRPVTYRATGIVECDEVAAALARATDVIQGNRAELEQQVAQAVQRTRLAEQRASQGQRVEALGRLTGGVAHDFNNLLGVVSNSAHLIERHPAAADLQMPLGGIHRAVAVGSQLTQHLLRFAGRRPVQPRAIELAGYLTEMEELVRSLLGKSVTVSVAVTPGTRPVRVDAGELELALINLVLNARDAMPGGGELRLRARNAMAEETEGLDGHPQRAYVLISVGDDGAGIDPAVTERLFEPFFTTKPVGKGTGLGLAQVMGFCVQAGGTARVASTPGLGTAVSLLLPAAQGDEPAGPPERAAPPADAAALDAMRGARVLLVEDNAELAEVTAALLRVHGLQVQRAADAADALQQLASPHGIDVVLSDVVMPGEMDGLALARRLQQQQPTLPVILVSGYSETAVRADDLRVLRKPLSEGELLRALAHALAARTRR